MEVIQDPPGGSQNPTQYCKQQACWKRISEMEFEFDLDDIESMLASLYQIKHQSKVANRAQGLDNELTLEIELMSISKDEWFEITKFAIHNGCFSASYEPILKKITQTKSISKFETKKIKPLLDDVIDLGFERS